MTYYRQCKLEQRSRGLTGPLVREQVAWIPEEFSNLGKYVKLDSDGFDAASWQVKEVGSHRQSEDYVQDHERDFLGHRKRTDV